jgi:hypothetical protein
MSDSMRWQYAENVVEFTEAYPISRMRETRKETQGTKADSRKLQFHKRKQLKK